MPTKSELLEEKTVKELKQMAKEKGLSGYSRARKDELIDLVKSGYTKAEIESWGGEEETPEEKEVEREAPEEEAEEVESAELEEDLEETEPVGDLELGEELEEISEPEIEEEPEMFKQKIIGAIILLVIVLVILVLWYALA